MTWTTIDLDVRALVTWLDAARELECGFQRDMLHARAGGRTSGQLER